MSEPWIQEKPNAIRVDNNWREQCQHYYGDGATSESRPLTFKTGSLKAIDSAS